MPGSILFNLFALVVFIFIPLIYISGTLDGVQPVRLLTISLFLVVFGGLLYLGGRLKSLPVKLWNNPLVWLLFAYLMITTISMAFAINVKETYFDIAKTLTFFVFTLFLVAILFDTNNWEGRITKFIIIAAYFSVIIGIYQLFKYVIFSEADFLPDGRSVIYQVRGLMAHKNQYSINLMLMLPMLVYGLIAFESKSWRRLSLLAIVAVSIMIIILQTRSVWTALLITSFILIIFSSIFYKRIGMTLKSRKLILTSYFAFIALLFSILIFVPSRNEFSRLSQLKSIADPEGSNNEFRLKIWKVTADMIADYPLTGVGAGNWKLHSANYYAGQDLHEKQLNWIRPHNDVLWVFAEKGIAGIIVYIGIFLVTIYYLIITFSRTSEQKTRLLAILIAGGFFCYHISSLFSFPLERINQQIYFHFFAAAAIVLYFKTQQNAGGAQQVTSKISLILVVILIFPIVYSSAILRSDGWLTKARFSLEREAWKNLFFETNNAETWARNLDPEANPLDWYKGLAYSGMNDPANALETYKKALEAHPNKIIVIHNIGIIYSRLGDKENAILYLNKALDIVPTYKASLLAMATFYVEDENYPETLQMLERIRQKQRDVTVVQNLRFVRKAILDQVMDEAFLMKKLGRNEEARQLFDSATRIYHSPDRFLEVLDSSYSFQIDKETLLDILKMVPSENRSESFRQRIEQLKLELDDDGK